jgi:hypothetical protein
MPDKQSTVQCRPTFEAVAERAAQHPGDRHPNPNLEQFGGRRVPFFGNYITVAAQEDTIGAVWTEQRDAALGTESTGSDQDNADVAGDPETVGGTCTSSLTDCFDTTPGLNQNIYAASITP